jgi:prepilin peptidase CpaA
MFWIPLAILAIACIYDFRSREIPDWIPILLIVTAAVAVGFDGISVSFYQLLLGVLVGFGVMATFGLAGGLGGGDVKLVAALGAWLGPIALLVVLFWIALIGMLLAIGFRLAGKKDLPYAPAIALGFAVFLIWPQGILRLLKWLQA